MNFEYIHEFQVFSRYLNFTKAANYLGISASNLRKHISKLESEIGKPLITHGAQCTLTPIGKLFLKKSKPLINAYNKLAERCYHIEKSHISELAIQDIHAFSEASKRYLELIEGFRRTYPDIPICISRITQGDFEKVLESHILQMGVIYEYGNPDDIIEDYRDIGFIMVYLASESVLVWCNKDSKFSRMSNVTVQDLENIPIMIQNKTYDPLLSAFRRLLENNGISPTFQLCKADSYTEFLLMDVSDEVYLILNNSRFDPRVNSKHERVLIPLKEGTNTVHAFAIMPIPRSDSEMKLAHYLEQWSYSCSS